MIHTWLEIGLSNALVATALAAGALLITRRLRPQRAFAIWLLVLVKLLVPPLWNAPLGTLRAWLPATEAAPTSDWLAGDNLNWTLPHPATDALPAERTSWSPIPQAVAPSEASGLARPRVSTGVLVFSVWGVGAAAWCILAGWRMRKFVVGLRQARRAPADLQHEASGLAERLGLNRLPLVRLSHRRVPPLVWSLFGRPTILLPAGLLRTLSPPQRTALLMHELVHLRRRDHWVKLVELAALALYWWLPAAWWARRKLEQAAEHCCDAEVVTRLPNTTAAYAEALVATIDFLSERPTPLPLGASGFSQFGHVSRRIEMILQPQSRRQRTLISCAVLVAAGAAVLPLSVRTLWAEPAVSASTEETNKDKPSNSDEPKPEASPDDDGTPIGGKLAEGGAGKDWNVNYQVGAVEIEGEFVRAIREQHLASEIEQKHRNRREAATRQLRSMHKGYDDGTVTLDQLLESQRRVHETKRAYAAAVCELIPDADRRKVLLAEANLVIANQSVNEARKTWANVYKRAHASDKGGEPSLEARAREQFYQFKLQVNQAAMESQQAVEAHGKKTGALPNDAEILSRGSEVEAILQNQDEKHVVIVGPVTAGGPPRPLDPPSDDEVLRAATKAWYVQGRSPIERKNVRIVREKLVEKVDPPSDHPELGRAQQHHVCYRCSIYGTTPTGHEASDVIYIDHVHFHVVSGATESSTGKKRDLSVTQGEQLRRERTQFRHYELQLGREKAKLKDMEDALAALEHEDDPKDLAQRDQDKNDLVSLIGIAKYRVEMRERELNAAKGLLLRRLLSDVGSPHAEGKRSAERY